MPAPPDPAYGLLERTVDIHSVLTEAQFLDIHRLLDQPPGRFKNWPDRYLFDLTDAPEPERVLAYLREHQLPHIVAEERYWPADRAR
jgi:hypothetical protein